MINEKRNFYNFKQSVNRNVYLVPLSYTSVEDGVKKIFAMWRKENSQKMLRRRNKNPVDIQPF